MRNTLAALLACFATALNAGAQLRELKPGWNLFSPQQDIQLGREAAEKMAKDKPLVHDPALEAYVTRIGNILMRSPHAGKWPFQFHIVNDKHVNAFALPGGQIFINIGAIDVCDNEAELASVMAHEMSHVNLRHGTNQITKAAAVQVPAMLVAALAGKSIFGQLVRAGIGLTANSVLLKFSRSAESEADYNGVEIMADVGYNPLAMAHFFEKLESKKTDSRLGSLVAEFSSTHPNPGNRIKSIEVELRDVPRKQYVETKTTQFAAMKQEALRVPPPRKFAGAPNGQYKALQTDTFNLEYPANWQPAAERESKTITIAPPEGVVKSSVGYGMQINYYVPQSGNVVLDRDTRVLVEQIKSSNPELTMDAPESIEIGGQPALITSMSNKSPFPGETEVDLLITVRRPRGLFYIILIAPQSESGQVKDAFVHILQSVRFN